MIIETAPLYLFKEVRGFLEYEILPGIEEVQSIIIDQGLGLKDVKSVAGVPLEWFAASIVDLYPLLSSGFKNKFPKPCLEDPEFLAALKKEVRGFIEIKLAKKEKESDEEFEGRIKSTLFQAKLPQLIAKYQLIKRLSAELEAESKESRQFWEKAIKEHNELVLRSLSKPLEDFIAEGGLPKERAQPILNEVKKELNDGKLGLHRFPPEEYETALRQIIYSSAEKVANTLPELRRREERNQFFNQIEEFSFSFLKTKRVENLRDHRKQVANQGRRHSLSFFRWRERARLAAYITARLNPELVQSPEFIKTFGDWIGRFDPTQITNPQLLAQKTRRVVQTIVNKTPRFATLPVEARAKLSQIEEIKQISKDFFFKPPIIVTRLPPVLTRGEKEATGVVEKALKKGLYVEGKEGKPGRYRLPNFTDEALSSLAKKVIERLTKQALVDRIYEAGQQIDETKKTEERQKAIENLESIVQKELEASFEEFRIRFPTEEEEKEVFNKVVEGLFPEQKFALKGFVSGEKKLQTGVLQALKQVESAPGLFFTSLLPGPLKPVGLVLDILSLIPGSKPLLFAGYLGTDKEGVDKLRRFYQSEAIAQEREVDLLENLYGKEAEVTIKAKGEAENYQRYARFLGHVSKTIEKPPSIFLPLKEFLKRFVGVKKITPTVAPTAETPSVGAEAPLEAVPHLPLKKPSATKAALFKVEKPSFSGHFFTALGGGVARAEAFINKNIVPPLPFLKELPRLRVSLPPFAPRQLLDKLSGAFLYFRKPEFFTKLPELVPARAFFQDELGKVYFKFSLPVISEKVSIFWNRVKSFFQGARPFASGVISFVGRLFSKGGSFLKLGLNIVPVFRIPLLVGSFLGKIFSFVGGLISPGPPGLPTTFIRKRGGLISFVLSLVSNPTMAIPVLAVGAIVFITLVGFGASSVGISSVAPPYQLQQLKAPGVKGTKTLDLEEKISTQTPTPLFLPPES